MWIFLFISALCVIIFLTTYIFALKKEVKELTTKVNEFEVDKRVLLMHQD